MPFLIILFVFLGLHVLYSTSKKNVFLVQPFMTCLKNDKKTAECGNPWEISRLPADCLIQSISVFLVFVEK